MSHQLKMAKVQAILQLHALGWSARRIAEHLGIDRGTVGRYLRLRNARAKPAIPPPGSEGLKPATSAGFPGPGGENDGGTDLAGDGPISKPAISPPGSESPDGPKPAVTPPGSEDTKPAISPAGSPESEQPSRVGRRSECEPHREAILVKLGQGLSAQRIFQDLVEDHGFTAGYDSVKRFVRSLGRKSPLPMRRLESAPGQEAQVDFGKGARILTPEGKRRKTHVFRIVLSHSRKAYSESTFRQTTEDFIRCIENAFWHFGGVPRTLVVDNLKAAVKHPDWYDPELVPKLEAFCRHYGTVILPTKPRMPRHKGKVERGVGYVQDNSLKGREFDKLEAQNHHLLHWETNVADTRVHGTTRKQVGKAFREVEQPALLPLPTERFPFFHEARRKVNRDGHVEVAKAYYSVPPEYLRRTVWARWDERLVRIFNDRLEQIALHVRREPGRFSTHPEHVPREKISGVERGATYLLRKVSFIGPNAHRWAEAMLHARGIEGTRVLQGLISLADRYPASALENACEIALSYGVFRLRPLRQLLKRKAPEQRPLPFLDEHPIIRPLDNYAQVVATALERKEERFGRNHWAKEYVEEEQPKGPASGDRRGAADILPPRSGYPSSGCSPAEPDSVSPDTPSVTRSFFRHNHFPQETHNDE